VGQNDKGIIGKKKSIWKYVVIAVIVIVVVFFLIQLIIHNPDLQEHYDNNSNNGSDSSGNDFPTALSEQKEYVYNYLLNRGSSTEMT